MQAGSKPLNVSAHYDLLVVGGGMAAGRLLKQLHELNYQKSIALVSLETCAGYNRVLLPGLLSGRYQEQQLASNDAWLSRPNLSLLAGSAVEEINLSERTARIGQETNIRFTQLVFATGSTVPRPQLPGSTLDNLFELRCMTDAKAIRRVRAEAKRAVVIGGGLLGLEAADALGELGLHVTVVHRGSQLMNRQLDQDAGEQLAQALEAQGIAVKLGAQVTRFLGAKKRGVNKVSAVTLDDGSNIATDLVLFATGTNPNTRLAAQAGVHCDHGIVTDRQLRTSAVGVYALGECAAIDGNSYALVEATNAQADALAQTLAGRDTCVDFCTAATRLKVSSLAVFAAGQTRPATGEECNDIVIRDRSAGIYRRLLFSGCTLIGAVLLGDINAAREITQRIGSVVEGSHRDRLAFGSG